MIVFSVVRALFVESTSLFSSYWCWDGATHRTQWTNTASSAGRGPQARCRGVSCLCSYKALKLLGSASGPELSLPPHGCPRRGCPAVGHAHLAPLVTCPALRVLVFPVCLFIYLVVSRLSRSGRHLVPRPGVKTGPPALGARRLNHCTARAVPSCLCFLP